MLVEQRRKAEAEQLVKEGQSLLAQANEQKDRRQRADQLIVARDKFSAAVQIDDHNVSAHTNLGVIFLINSDYIFAQEHLERAAKLDPGSPLAYYNLAAAYSRDEQKGLSLDALDKAIGNGFQDCKQIMRDPDLQFIRTAAKPAFQAILKDRDSPCALQLGTIRQ
jgi:tetratricopeptide (TPR) repeat protein